MCYEKQPRMSFFQTHPMRIRFEMAAAIHKINFSREIDLPPIIVFRGGEVL